MTLSEKEKYCKKIKKLYLNYTNKEIAELLDVSLTFVNKYMKEMNLKRHHKYNIPPTEEQKKFIIDNRHLSPNSIAKNLNISTSLATRWYKDIIKMDENNIDYPLTKEELEEHYHILCIWYLRGFSVQNIIQDYNGKVTEDDIKKALLYNNGKLLKKTYISIKLNNNPIIINDNSLIGKDIKNKVKKWDKEFIIQKQ